jgi:LmbE family N-acetylglucosaminyl deacetylase
MLDMKRTEALVIVAHPDDETVWMGGTILKNRGWDWTILSLCRADDRDRKPKFDRVCKIYRAFGSIHNVDDKILQPMAIPIITNLIKKSLAQKKYDLIFTHGENGEYGHIRHIETHNAVKEMIKNRELVAKKVYFFNYKKGDNVPYPQLKVPEPIESSDFISNLGDKELELKKRIIREVYGYPNEKGFELMSCNKMESFSLMR